LPFVDRIEIRPAAFDSPVAQALVTAALADLGARYGGSGDDTPVSAEDFVAPRGTFLVAYADGEPVGCGAWRRHGDAAELKRMFTTAGARGRGIARRVLAAVEESARQHGLTRLILECGHKQPEAVALYKASGYVVIENFGYYRHHPGTISFGRSL
jgi:GNAT superfamily N-acetyltransferase